MGVRSAACGALILSSLMAIAAEPSARSAAASAGVELCVAGQAVEVLNVGVWFPAMVLEGPDALDTCLVSYDGFDSSWDEWVSVARLRLAPTANAGTATPAAGNESATAVSGPVPPGKYGCYTFDAGQTNYTFTDVEILDDSRYAVGKERGTYVLTQDGTLSFTGTLSNATGRFSIKSGGTPQIDLIFFGDARASMGCPKAR